jgi:hypothetical protein
LPEPDVSFVCCVTLVDGVTRAFIDRVEDGIAD